MVILTALLVVAALAAVFSLMASATAKKKADEVTAIKVQLERDVEDALKRKASLEQELQQLKQDLRGTKDENKSLKKKRFDEKKSIPATTPELVEAAATTTTTPAAPSTDSVERARLEKQWDDAFVELTALKAKNSTLERELADVQQKATSRGASSDSDKQVIASLRDQIAVEKKRVGAEEKAIMDMRRKVEWHRRIYLVQQKELEKEQDKTAHIRQRFLDVCVDVVGLQKLTNAVAPSLASEQSLREVERLQTEQSAYKAAQELEAKKDKSGDDKAPAATVN